MKYACFVCKKPLFLATPCFDSAKSSGMATCTQGSSLGAHDGPPSNRLCQASIIFFPATRLQIARFICKFGPHRMDSMLHNSNAPSTSTTDTDP